MLRERLPDPSRCSRDLWVIILPVPGSPGSESAPLRLDSPPRVVRTYVKRVAVDGTPAWSEQLP